ncbi:hypothetical protein ACFL0M_08750 [Thermodesulfobacteriota bacterium]
MDVAYDTLRLSIKAGIRKGWGGYVWIIKIIVPISFLTFLIDYSGWINTIDFVLKPVMGLLSLPSSAVLPLLAGLLTGIYGTIAAMAVMSFSRTQMTLIAVFILISHNLIQEGVVQSKSGLNPLISTPVRLGSPVIMVMLLARLMAAEAPAATAAEVYSYSQPFTAMLRSWLHMGGSFKNLKILMQKQTVTIPIYNGKSFYGSLERPSPTNFIHNPA